MTALWQLARVIWSAELDLSVDNPFIETSTLNTVIAS